MNIRRIVTGHAPSGMSMFASDSAPPCTREFESVPGFKASLVWGTSSPSPIVASPYHDPTIEARSWLPGAGGTNLLVITFPPDSVMAEPGFDAMAAGMEYARNIPGLAERFEPEHPGMHTTPTVDYAMLLEGEIHLELDAGHIRKLVPHDIVIQQGTRHAWRNPSNAPATMLFVLVGVDEDVGRAHG